MEKIETKIAIVAVVISDADAVTKVNSIFHEFRDYVIGRLGIPYKQKCVNVISVVLDAPNEVVNALSGKLGMVKGASSKVLITK